MRPSSPLRILLLTTLLAAAAAVLLVVSGPAYADPGTAPADGVWPLDPRPEVVSRFDPPETRWGAGHRGVDLAGHVGQPVRAAAPGRVTFAGRLAGRGVVVVDHGGTRTTYEPVAASVAVGDTVARRRHAGPAASCSRRTASRAPACTGASSRAPSTTSTRSPSSGPAPSGCSRWTAACHPSRGCPP